MPEQRPKAYLDNVIVCGKVRGDLSPPAEMAAILAVYAMDERCEIEILTSPESWREQDRSTDDVKRAAFRQSRPDVALVREYERPSG